MVSLNTKLAMVPDRLVVDRVVPFLVKVNPEIPERGPVPESVRLKPVMLTVVPLGLVNTT